MGAAATRGSGSWRLTQVDQQDGREVAFIRGFSDHRASASVRLSRSILASLAVATGLLCACGSTPAVAPLGSDEVNLAAANATYRFEGQDVTLVNGTTEQPVRGSLVNAVVSLSPMQASGELSGHGKFDAVVVLTQTGGKVGTFSYIAVLLADAAGQLASTSTNVQLIGDRVILKNIGVDRGTITVDYLDYNTGQSKQSAPSLVQSRKYKVVAGVLSRS